ncbi:MAG: molybdenum cofactor biosynthesis protein MoaE [Smithella sp.]|jgi:molybdopterin synthase catalytic subunit|nr:molybdenum cofactor biosynthesis protein MoaE [Smithellaceae bacterium]NLA42287.1 molybdenum cofactor biosynthesis protein MoaE [Smithella sp.]
MVDQWIEEIKKKCPPDRLGMILVHNGVVRAVSKSGSPVARMNLSFDRAALDKTVRRFKAREGIVEIRAWINEGVLNVGDDIMVVCVAGRFRADVLPVFQELVALIKTEIVTEDEAS